MNITTLHETKPTNNVTLENMTSYQICRWAALKEAVDIIGEKCEEKNIELTSDLLQPLELLSYVESVTDTLYNQVLQNEKA
jgi:hypothetical protein